MAKALRKRLSHGTRARRMHRTGTRVGVKIEKPQVARTKRSTACATKNRLFVAQGDHRIDPCGPAGGNVAGGEGHGGEDGGHQNQRPWIARADAKQEAGQQMRKAE